ncbi:MAG: murein biosynthesis integral membrane protein MurJ [Chloroflexi bacterium]|nr:murein biosynthesis integral membrane protein MurJ [Chloroflexota bacterium]
MKSHPSPVENTTEHSPAETQQATNARVARATGVLALGNISSRVLGLAREVVLSNLFGAGAAVDAYRVAVNIITAFYDLLIGGHVNGALIPVLSEVLARKGRNELWRLVSILCSLVTVALALLVIAIVVFAPQIVTLNGSGFDAETTRLAIDLLRLTAPALLFLSLFAVLSGTLYALRMFHWPAFAGALFNGTIVLVTLVFVSPPQFTAQMDGLMIGWTQARAPEAITITALGWLAGALAQVFLQLPGLRGAAVRFTLVWRHPALRQIARLYAPVIFSLVLDTLVIRQFSYNLASQTGTGSIGYMGWATTLIQFPQGLVATAISIAILPTLARQAALIADSGEQAFKDTLGLGLRLATTLIVPAAVGLFVLAVPIVALIFQHGAFTAHDTAMTALALRLYLVGLPFAALDLLLVYAFYARQDTLTPALVGLLSLAVYMVVAVALLPTYGLFSLMIADSVKHIVHASVSAYLLWRRLKGLGGQRLALTFVKVGLAAVGLALVTRTALVLLVGVWGIQSFWLEALTVVVAGGTGSLVYLGAAWTLRVEELRWLLAMLRQRLGRGG